MLQRIITSTVVHTRLTISYFFQYRGVDSLGVRLFTTLIACGVGFLVTHPTSDRLVTPTRRLRVSSIFRGRISIPRVTTRSHLTSSIVNGVVLLIKNGSLFTLRILPLRLVRRMHLTTMFSVIRGYFQNGNTLLIFRRLYGENHQRNHSRVNSRVNGSPFRRIGIASFVSLRSILRLSEIRRVIGVLLKQHVHVTRIYRVKRPSNGRMLLRALLGKHVEASQTMRLRRLSR